jgi:hypothetical protein
MDGPCKPASPARAQPYVIKIRAMTRKFMILDIYQ